MVTYRLRRSRPQVRILAPHPLFFIFAVFLLCGSAGASDQDYYAVAPDTLVLSVVSSDSLARVVGGDIFGHYWSSFGGDGQITAIDGVSMTGRADGVQQLATATYSTFKGVESSIAQLSSDSAQWLQLIYGTLQQSGDLGTVYTRLLEVLQSLQGLQSSFDSSWSYRDYFWNGTNSLVTSTMRGNGLLSLLTSFFTDLFNIQAVHVRDFYNSLPKIFYGSGDSLIYGLDYTGYDKEGYRGSWSLADISANGFSGLASLISGSGSSRGDYVWLGSNGFRYESSSLDSMSLMHMVGEGFLGLAYDLWPDRSDSLQQVLLDFVSPDDGVSSQQYEHNNLAQLIAGGFSGLQVPLARLAYVLADLDDVALKQQEQPNIDAVKDDFFGDGQAAVKPSDIKDVAGFSSSIKDSFGGVGSAGDAFQAINDSDSFWFFSQEVADDLDSTSALAVLSDDPESFFDQFSQDEDGFYSLIDLSPWDVSKYLGGE